MLKPRRRIWNQSGVKELVTITAPRKEHVSMTDGLTQTEVKSRLHALADTLDSRGWAVKNSAVNLYSQPALVMGDPNDQERLLSIADMPQQATPIDVHDSDDMLDEQNNANAKQMDSMIAASAKAHRRKIIETLNQPEPPMPPKPEPSRAPTNNYWFLNQPAQGASVADDMVTFNTQVVSPTAATNSAPEPDLPSQTPAAAPGVNEEELVQELEARKRELPMTAYYGHLHTIQPLSAQAQAQRDAMQQGTQNRSTSTPGATHIGTGAPASGDPATSATPSNGAMPAFIPTPNPNPQGQPAAQQQNPQDPATQPVTPAQQAAILQLANNDDLNVATLAREAHRSEEADGEVVIKLH
jgi:hypothetical protein